MRTVPRVRAVVALLVVAGTLSVGAHDFWLVPDAIIVGPNADIVVRGQTSSAFPTSESAVTLDRIVDARVVGGSGEETIAVRSTEGASLVLRHRPKSQGQQVIAVSLGWRSVKETANSFRNYLVLEGAEDALKRYEAAGTLPTAAVVRRYAKYGKTLVEFGTGPRAFDRVLGQPLEFVPLADPGSLRPGSTLRVRVLFQGAPLARARVHGGMAPSSGRTPPPDITLLSGDDGVIAMPVGAPGLWNIRTIHVVPAPAGADADWDVHWASFVFSVR